MAIEYLLIKRKDKSIVMHNLRGRAGFMVRTYPCGRLGFVKGYVLADVEVARRTYFASSFSTPLV